MIDADLRRRLETTYALFKKWEREGVDGRFPPEALADLARELRSYAGHAPIEVSKLADLERHLHPGLTLRTLAALVVPIERALQKNVRDDDVLPMTTADRVVAFENPRARETIPLRLIVDDLRSAFNVGSILRTADGLAVEKVHLCGYTPSPDEGKTRRAALGAQQTVAWERNPDLGELLSRLRGEGWRTVALETAPRALDLDAEFPAQPTAFVLGNERFGLRQETLAACDELRRLPLMGMKNSLNVGVIAAIAAYEWKRQWTLRSR